MGFQGALPCPSSSPISHSLLQAAQFGLLGSKSAWGNHRYQPGNLMNFPTSCFSLAFGNTHGNEAFFSSFLLLSLPVFLVPPFHAFLSTHTWTVMGSFIWWPESAAKQAGQCLPALPILRWPRSPDELSLIVGFLLICLKDWQFVLCLKRISWLVWMVTPLHRSEPCGQTSRIHLSFNHLLSS